MIELVTGEGNQATLGVGGDTYNSAVYLVRGLKGTGISVSYVTALGKDPYSDRIVDAMTGHDVDTTYIERRADQMPGLYAIDTDEFGERSFSYWRSAAAAKSLFAEPCDVGLTALNDFDLVLLSGITLAILPAEMRDKIVSWAVAFTRSGGTLVYDSNHRPALWESRDAAQETNAELWKLADIALPSIDDEMDLFGDPDEASVIARLQGYGVNRGAMKRGADGPYDLSGQKHDIEFPAAAKIVDSTAAGDSFNAGYLASVALGKNSAEAMLSGHNLAARVIGESGAIISE